MNIINPHILTLSYNYMFSNKKDASFIQSITFENRVASDLT